MEQGPAAQHDPARPVSARARITAAVRDDAGGRALLPSAPEPEAVDDRPPALPADEGLEPVRRLGRRCWLVRESRSGEHFVLRPCGGSHEPGGAGGENSRSSVRALAVGLAGLDEPHVVAVRGLLGPAAAPLGLVEDFLAGGSLADRLAGGGRLGPAELVPVLRDAATGLAVLHALGRCAGGLGARRILFRAAGPSAAAGSSGSTGPTDPPGGVGRPVAAVRAGTAAGSPQDDVRDLGAVGWTALTGRAPAADEPRVSLALLCPHAPPGLVEVLEAALAADPAVRPTAAQLAARLEAPPEPGPDPAAADPAGGGHRTGTRGRSAGGPGTRAGSTGARSTGGRGVDGRGRPGGRLPPRAAVLLTGVVLLVSAGAVARGTAGSSAPAPPPETAAAPGPSAPSSWAAAPDAAAGVPPDRVLPDDPGEALGVLVARRGEALRTGDAGLLEQVYAPGAAAAAADRELIARSAGAGTFADLVLEVGRARELPPDPGAPAPGTVEFTAEIRVDGYRGDPGADPSVVPAGNGWVQSVRVVLVHGAPGWRLAGVVPAVEGTAAGAAPATEGPRG